VEPVASPLQGRTLRGESGGEGSPLRGAGRELRPAVEVEPGGSVHPGSPHLLEQRVARGLVLPPQRRQPVAEVHRPRADRPGGPLDIRSARCREAAPGSVAGGAAAASRSRLDGGGGSDGVPSSQGDAAVPASPAPRPDDSGGASGGEPDVSRGPHPRRGTSSSPPDGRDLQGGGS
jgi:hypothetical protein